MSWQTHLDEEVVVAESKNLLAKLKTFQRDTQQVYTENEKSTLGLDLMKGEE